MINVEEDLWSSFEQFQIKVGEDFSTNPNQSRREPLINITILDQSGKRPLIDISTNPD